jgi:hypothetical protein
MKQKPHKEVLEDAKRVAALHERQLKEVTQTQATNAEQLSGAIDSSEQLVKSLGMDLPTRPAPTSAPPLRPVVVARAWEDILAEAQAATPKHVDFNRLLTQDEIDAVLKRHDAIGNELSWFGSLDRYDLAISVAAGVIAGVIDVLLVRMPAHSGFMGSRSDKGGWLSNQAKEKMGRLFPAEKIQDLEKMYRVPYDASTSSGLKTPIDGLGPGTHRFQSLGHDPLLGFLFGVADILAGEFHGITKTGRLIIQKTADPFLVGEQFFVRVLEAMQVQLGHLASDVATARGLPAPLMPLLQFLQFGKIGKHEYSIGEVARQMYRSGYDARHFMAASVPVIIAEAIVRIGYFVRSIKAGKPFKESIPVASSLRLRRQLLVAHSTAVLINAGKVYITQNPLGVSWPQVLAFLRYLGPEVTFLLFGKEAARSKMVEDEIVTDYQGIGRDLDAFIAAQGDFLLVV